MPRAGCKNNRELILLVWLSTAAVVEFLVFDDEGHGVIKLKNKQVAYPAIIAFLNKSLQC